MNMHPPPPIIGLATALALRVVDHAHLKNIYTISRRLEPLLLIIRFAFFVIYQWKMCHFIKNVIGSANAVLKKTLAADIQCLKKILQKTNSCPRICEAPYLYIYTCLA